MNFLNSPSVFKKKKDGGGGCLWDFFLSFLCFGDLPWPSTGRIFQCRSVAVTHVMCWRGLRRKQRRQEGVILVCSPARVGACPCVKGWACLAQNTDCTSSTNLCTKTPLGGWRGGEHAHISQCGRQHWEASKLPLNSWAVGRDGYTGENKRRSGGEGGEEHISRFSSCKSRPGWSRAKTLFLLPVLLCRKPSTFSCRACSLSLSRKTQTTKEKMCSIKRHHIKDPPPHILHESQVPLLSCSWKHIITWMKLTNKLTCDVSVQCLTEHSFL